MVQFRAPYHDGMRLGQGFNSYTQQICLDNAVLENTLDNRRRVAHYYIPDADLKGGPDYDPNTPRPTEEPQATSDSYTVQVSRSAGTNAQDSLVFQPAPWTKAQVVTYSSRFVDKVSDVTDSMNISGALSIQTGTVGGKGSGSYVDSDKIKESDITFHIQVKVRNQLHDFEEYSLFNKIHTVADADFPAVYGDCFISGWEEGGEFNAIVSMKVSDKSKVFQIKADLQAHMNVAAISGEIKASVNDDKEDNNSDTETTVTVNWSGGGRVKEPDEAWTIDSMKKAAAAFPDLIAMTPQRTHAILTKYTALESFQRQKANYSLLDYENAGIYTGALLDHYMDYKMLWKQLSVATNKLDAGRAIVGWSKIDQDTSELAVLRTLPDDQVGAKLRQSSGSAQAIADARKPANASLQITGQGANNGAVGQDKPSTGTNDDWALASQSSISSNAGTVVKQPTPLDWENVPGSVLIDRKIGDTKDTEKVLKFSPFSPNFGGLITASKVCRFEMAKIVNEVDLVTKDPSVALDPRRDSFFLHPVIFKQLLPIVRTWTDDMPPENRANGPVILGYTPPLELSKPLPDITMFHNTQTRTKPFADSIKQVANKADNYRMNGWCGTADPTVLLDAQLFNDLETLDATYRPLSLSVWKDGRCVIGVQVTYTNGKVMSHGLCDETAPHWSLLMASDGSEVISDLYLAHARDKPTGTYYATMVRAVTTEVNELNTNMTANAGMTPPLATAAKPDENLTEAEKQKLDEKTKSSVDAKAIESARLKVLDLDTDSTSTWPRPDVTRSWSFRGFFGFIKDNIVISLGVIWGADNFVPVPPAPMVAPLCRNYFRLGISTLRDLRKRHPEFSGNFLIGDYLWSSSAKTYTMFNDLDNMWVDWKLKSLGFTSKNGQLSGIRVDYTNGRGWTRGVYDDSAQGHWQVNVETDLVAFKATGGCKKTGDPWQVQTVEFIRAGSTGSMPDWLLDVSTLRYLGDGDGTTLVNSNQIMELAPPTEDGHKNWSVRGFYGWTDNDTKAIGGLGVIWGRG